jgi:hypothetical protein
MRVGGAGGKANSRRLSPPPLSTYSEVTTVDIFLVNVIPKQPKAAVSKIQAVPGW